MATKDVREMPVSEAFRTQLYHECFGRFSERNDQYTFTPKDTKFTKHVHHLKDLLIQEIDKVIQDCREPTEVTLTDLHYLNDGKEESKNIKHFFNQMYGPIQTGSKEFTERQGSIWGLLYGKVESLFEQIQMFFFHLGFIVLNITDLEYRDGIKLMILPISKFDVDVEFYDQEIWHGQDALPNEILKKFHDRSEITPERLDKLRRRPTKSVVIQKVDEDGFMTISHDKGRRIRPVVVEPVITGPTNVGLATARPIESDRQVIQIQNTKRAEEEEKEKTKMKALDEREIELNEHESRLNLRSRGLDELEEALNEYNDKLDERIAKVDKLSAFQDEHEARLNAREETLKQREEEIEQAVTILKKKISELKEWEDEVNRREIEVGRREEVIQERESTTRRVESVRSRLQRLL